MTGKEVRSKRRTVDREVFVDGLVAGDSARSAYVKAGGKDGNTAHQAACRLKNSPEVQKLYRNKINELAMESIASLVRIGPDAIQHMHSVLKTSENEKLKTSISKDVLNLIKDVIPKEVNHQHNHEIEVPIENALEQLAEQLFKAQDQGRDIRTVEGTARDVTPDDRRSIEGGTADENECVEHVPAPQETKIIP